MAQQPPDLLGVEGGAAAGYALRRLQELRDREHPVTAVYSGDNYYNASTSQAVSVS